MLGILLDEQQYRVIHLQVHIQTTGSDMKGAPTLVIRNFGSKDVFNNMHTKKFEGRLTICVIIY